MICNLNIKQIYNIKQYTGNALFERQGPKYGSISLKANNDRHCQEAFPLNGIGILP